MSTQEYLEFHHAPGAEIEVWNGKELLGKICLIVCPGHCEHMFKTEKGQAVTTDEMRIISEYIKTIPWQN